jgi:hypothetical protein
MGVTIFLIINLANQLPTLHEIPRIEVLLTRFACSFALHMYMQSEWDSGMGNMKLVINHPYRFAYPIEAFMIGLTQVLAAALIEVANVMQVLTNKDEIEVVMNFMALAILSDFDNFFFQAQSMTGTKEIVLLAEEIYRPLYTITRTTSAYANSVDFRNRHTTQDETLELLMKNPDEFEKFKYFHVEPKLEGGCKAWCMHAVYKFVRLFQVSFWYYFAPYSVLFLSYAIPYYVNQSGYMPESEVP